MNKIYSRVLWENEPSYATPLNEANLNRMDYAIDQLDDRVVDYSITKLDTTTGNTLVQSVILNETTGVITITKLDGSTLSYDTALEKIAINFDFDPNTNRLILTLEDGTIKYVDLTHLIDVYQFDSTNTINVGELGHYHYDFSIKKGSITEEYLQPQYLADITQQANIAINNRETSEAWAVGKRNNIDVQETDETYHNNAKYYSDRMSEAITNVTPEMTIDFTTGELIATGSSWLFYIDNTNGFLCWEVPNL